MKFCTVDAFTHTLFKGNPAAVCVMDAFADDEFLQNVATEVNLPNTAFVVPLHDNHYAIRWFTPIMEVNLSGHSTLAAAHVLWTELEIATREAVYFESKSGILKASKNGAAITLDLPAYYTEPSVIPDGLYEALGVSVVSTSASNGDYIIELHSVDEVTELVPDIQSVLALDCDHLIVTAEAPSEYAYDYVCRVFCPKLGIAEDAVTGIAHCKLATYWSERLQKSDLTAYQASKRGGALLIKHEGDRVLLTGEAITAFSGKFLGFAHQDFAELKK